MRILFKNKFLEKLGRAYKEKQLIFSGLAEPLVSPSCFYDMKEILFAKN